MTVVALHAGVLGVIEIDLGASAESRSTALNVDGVNAPRLFSDLSWHCAQSLANLARLLEIFPELKNVSRPRI